MFYSFNNVIVSYCERKIGGVKYIFMITGLFDSVYVVFVVCVFMCMCVSVY